MTVDDDEVVAFMALDGDMLEQLYVAPRHQRNGHGARLLRLAQTTRESLALWTFEGNLGAQRFYEARGFKQSGQASTNNEERPGALLPMGRALVQRLLSSPCTSRGTSRPTTT